MARTRPRRTPDLASRALVAARELDHLVIDLTRGRTPTEVTEAGGTLAGSWFANPLTTDGSQLLAAAMLLTGDIDRDQLEYWLREGWRRSRAAGRSYDPAAPRRSTE